MARAAVIACMLLALVAMASAFTIEKAEIVRVERLGVSDVEKTEGSMCPMCVSFFQQAMNQLINIIVNGGIVGTCGELCSKLPGKMLDTVCDLLCDYVGITEFMKLLQHEDPDPIFLCQELKICPVHDDGQASITNSTVSPTKGAQGTTFEITMVFEVTKQTGTGETAVIIQPPGGGQPMGTANLNEGFPPGKYGVTWKLTATPSEQEAFDAGVYRVETALCEGECGSKHPHSKVMDVGQTSFEITQQ